MTMTLLEAAFTDAVSDLACQINDEHLAVVGAMRDGLAHGKRAGELLLEVKAKLPHGSFMAWVQRHCEFSHRTATLYMRIAAEWDKIAANWQSLADLGLAAVDRWLTHGRFDPLSPEDALAELKQWRAQFYGYVPPDLERENDAVLEDRNGETDDRTDAERREDEWWESDVGAGWEQVAAFVDRIRWLLEDLQRREATVDERILPLVNQLADLCRAGLEADKEKMFAEVAAP